MMYKNVAKHILIPFYFTIKNNRMLYRLSELERTQYASGKEIEKLQIERLKRLLLHSYQKVPFYRERFDSVGFRPEHFSDLKEMQSIPYLTKKDVQNQPERLIAGNYDIKELIPDASGGSTGKPTNFYKDIRRHQDRRADQVRHDRWCGWDLGEKYINLWGAQREFDTQPSLRARLLERYVYRAYGFNAFDISEEKVLACLDDLRKTKPTMIIAYANVAYYFAKIILKNGIDLGDLRLKGLISSAETLTKEKRSLIEKAFLCKVLNRYGSREVGLIASECLKQEGLHINAENVFVEIEEKGKPVETGCAGEVIVTDFWNYGMPFIRYQMGDVGVKSSHVCSCGRGLPMVDKIKGRVSDFIVDTKGALVHGEYFTHLFYGITEIEQFQLIQESREKITLKILPRNDFNPTVLNPIIQKIKLCLGENVAVNSIICDKSFITASGKFRFTISKITGDYHKPE
ncbi:MAG TPA: hypothetical protein VF941_15690 [Clostridia bacterium]